jgi:predicted neutral ceramidase superfamily lipid hydrolase
VKRGTMMAAAGVLVIGALVYAAGLALAAPEGRGSLLVGVLVAVGFQLLVLAIAAVAFPDNALAAYGVGMLGRLLLVIAAALVILPAAKLQPEPFLYSLVTVLFATTLLEPVVMAAGARNAKGR